MDHERDHSYKRLNDDSPPCSTTEEAQVAARSTDHPTKLSTPDPPSWFQEIAIQLRTVWPTLLAMLLTRIPWMISLRFLGSLCNTEEFAAASFATSLANFTGLSFPFALISALATLTSQAKGELDQRIKQQRHDDTTIELGPDDFLIKVERTPSVVCTVPLYNQGVPLGSAVVPAANSGSCGVIPPISEQQERRLQKMTPLVYLYRGLFVNMLFIVPVSFWWLYGMRTTLVALNQEKELIELTLPYLRILVPGLWGISIQWTISCWLQSIGLAHMVPWVGVVGFALHIPANILLMQTFQLGYYGNAWATVINQCIQPILLVFYLTCTRHGRDQVRESIGIVALGRSCTVWEEVRAGISTGLLQFLKLSLPSLVATSQWWCGELCMVLAGNLPEPEVALGTISMFLTLNDMNYQLPFAWATAATMRIGNALGANLPKNAERAAMVSVACGVAMTASLALLIVMAPPTMLPNLFALESNDLVRTMSGTVVWLILFNVGDAIACTCNGIMKGCGRQLAELPAVVIAYWCMAIPLACFLGFTKEENVVGLTIGLAIGGVSHGLILLAVVVFSFNWREEAAEAQRRLLESSH